MMQRPLPDLTKYLTGHLSLYLAILLMLMLKIPHLSFNFSGDEAWSYYQAILKLADMGPSLLPGKLGLVDSRGHPLLFYFISAAWFNLLPGVIFFMRLLPLLISVAVLAAFHLLLRRHTQPEVTAISTLLLSVQSLFLAQASLVLPEMMLTLWLLLSFHFYLDRKYLWFALTASLMVMTKETGVMFTGMFGLIYIAENIRQTRRRDFLTNGLIMALPLMVYALFLLLHFRAYGSFFFNEHLEYMQFSTSQVMGKLRSASSNLAIRYGRSAISFAALVSLLLMVFRRQKPVEGRFLWTSLVLILALVLFSIFNFFTHRYILPVMPIFIGCCVALIVQAFQKHRWMVAAIAIAIFGSTLAHSLSKAGKGDNDLGYVQYLKVHQSVVDWCEAQQVYDSTISCGPNMLFALRDEFTGFLNKGKGFTTAALPKTEGSDMVVWDSTCDGSLLPGGFPEGWELVYETAYKKHWGKVFIRSNN
jgi:4-amino-4-deoxy-L-arabinose transferase-like glycosyltransferase